MPNSLSPIHPGETLRADVLDLDYELRLARQAKLKQIEREVRPKTNAA